MNGIHIIWRIIIEGIFTQQRSFLCIPYQLKSLLIILMIVIFIILIKVRLGLLPIVSLYLILQYHLLNFYHRDGMLILSLMPIVSIILITIVIGIILILTSVMIIHILLRRLTSNTLIKKLLFMMIIVKHLLRMRIQTFTLG